MNIFAVAVPSGSTIQTVDGISYDGELWLIPQWFDYPKENASKPAIMIRFDNLQHQKTEGSVHDYVINNQIPPGVLDGTIGKGFEILKGNEITFGLSMQRVEH